MPLKFVVTKDSSGRFSFSLISRNGQVLARSDPYKSRAGAMGGIRTVISQAGDAEVEDQSTKAWAAAEALQTAAAATKPKAAKRSGTTRKAASARPSAKKAPPRRPPRRAVPAQPEPEPETTAATPEPDPVADETPAAFAEPPPYEEEGPARRRVSMRSRFSGEPPEGWTRRVVSLRNPPD